MELGRIEVDGHSTQLVEGGRRAEGKKAEQGGIKCDVLVFKNV